MNKIILALDTTNLEEAISITKQIKNKIFTVKLGLEFFNSNSKSGIKKFNDIGINNLMLDLKLNDLPNTINRSILALKGIKFGYLTVMASFKLRRQGDYEFVRGSIGYPKPDELTILRVSD